jgi:hypothetical protein
MKCEICNKNDAFILVIYTKSCLDCMSEAMSRDWERVDKEYEEVQSTESNL